MSSMTRSMPLSLGIPKSSSPISSTITSPTDHGSNPSSPSALDSSKTSDYSRADHHHQSPTSPEITSLPPFPSSPKTKPRQVQESSKRFFSNLKASKSSHKIQANSELVTRPVEPTIRQVSAELSRSKVDLSEGSVYSRPSPGSTPDLSLAAFDFGPTEQVESRHELGSPNEAVLKPITGQPVLQGTNKAAPRPAEPKQTPSAPSGQQKADSSYAKKPKPRFANLITRSRSIRMDDNGNRSVLSPGRKSKPSTPISTGPQSHPQREYHSSTFPTDSPMTPMTAPLPPERTFRGDMSPVRRNHSAERRKDSEVAAQEVKYAHTNINPNTIPSAGPRDGAGSHLFSNIRNTSSRAAGGLNKAGNRIMAKMNRSGSSNNQKEEERYVCRYINLPLVEQTRRTRLADRLENSKDRTEFWMPALPWRCIDYLNFRGCEEEGLYRVPGSDREIRLWQKRFDQEGDINLFDEDNLYDINVIGSLFKSWLRELPTEILPKAVQTKIFQAHPDAEEVPQLLKDELSMLAPWNYYLLFAITCHLSLLTAYSNKNRMTYSNLVICFQPCLRIDNYCFQFLVQKWRDCWQGCWTEKEALEEEYRVLDELAQEDTPAHYDVAPGSSGTSSGASASGAPANAGMANFPTHASSSAGAAATGDDRSIGSSSGGGPAFGKPSDGGGANMTTTKIHLGNRPLTVSIPAGRNDGGGGSGGRDTHGWNYDIHSNSNNAKMNPGRVPREVSRRDKENGHARGNSQLPPLAPMEPLSPIGL